MSIFEYKVIELHNEGEKQLNQLGEKGWELVSVVYVETRGVMAYLKRPKQ